MIKLGYKASAEQFAPGKLLGFSCLAEDVGFDPIGGAEADERGVGDGELLVRGRRERERAVLGVERLAGLQIEGDGGRASLRDVRDGERLREAGRQRRLPGARRAGEDERGEKDDRQTATGHLTHSSEHEHGRQA